VRFGKEALFRAFSIVSSKKPKEEGEEEKKKGKRGGKAIVACASFLKSFPQLEIRKKKDGTLFHPFLGQKKKKTGRKKKKEREGKKKEEGGRGKRPSV